VGLGVLEEQAREFDGEDEGGGCKVGANKANEAQRGEVRSEREVDIEVDGPDSLGEGGRLGAGVLHMDSESN
jgi:hypothetical protein